ncbi:MAG TPA: SpoIID/LytB domain-containing protein [Candidatus Ozemobacteraceae bacterium]
MDKAIYNNKYIFICFILVFASWALFSPVSAAKAPKAAAELAVGVPLDTAPIRVSLFEGREPTTLRLQAMRGEWRVRLFPRPSASGSEPLLSGEETDVIPESEDIILMLTSKGITGRTSRGRELESGYTRVELSGGETLLIEIAGRQPVLLQGKLDVSLGVNILRFVNEIPFRAYLVSAVSEMTSSPEPEAIKAMVIAVRSRLARTIIDRRHATDSVDLCDKPHCMTFSGDAPNRELVSLITDRCADEIMVSGGKPMFARFQHTCGGKISSMKDIYEIDDPNHQALDDRLDSRGSENCFHSPSFNWVREFAQEEIADFLSVMFAGGAERVFLRWEPSKTDPAGRITEMILRGKREKKVRGTVFLESMQEQFGANSLRSMRFTVEPMRRSTIYRGIGSGDGVGMCLFGADGLAKKGLDAYRILMFYYRNFEFRKAGQPLVPQIPPSPPPGPGRIR